MNFLLNMILILKYYVNKRSLVSRKESEKKNHHSTIETTYLSFDQVVGSEDGLNVHRSVLRELLHIMIIEITEIVLCCKGLPVTQR